MLIVETPDLEVMGRDLCPEGHGFKSPQRILDGHFSRKFVEKIVMFVGKCENKRKRGR